MDDGRNVRQIAQDIDAKAEYGNRLAEQGNMLAAAQLGAQLVQARRQAEANRLQKEALGLQREANRRLEEIGVTQEELVALSKRSNQIADQSRRSLEALRANVSETNRLLGEQTGAIREVRDTIREQTRTQIGMGFASWRQTPEGAKYLEWAKRAGATLRLIDQYTERMGVARQKDDELNARRLFAERYEPKALPARPMEPDVPDAAKTPEPQKPGEFTEVMPSEMLGCGTSLLMLIGGAVAGGYLADPNLVAVPAGMAVGYALSRIIARIFYRPSKAMLEKQAAWRERKEAHEAEIEQYEAAKAGETDELKEARRAYWDWRRKLGQWDDACNKTNADNQTQRQRMLAVAALDAHGKTVPATHWAASNPLEHARGIMAVIQGVAKGVFPMPDQLPDPGMPPLARVESLPAEALHMRAELELIHGENAEPVEE